MGKNHKKHVSVVITGDYPEMWVPEMLRSPVRIKRFWYIRLWGGVTTIWGVLSEPFRKAPEGKPALEVSAKGGAE